MLIDTAKSIVEDLQQVFAEEEIRVKNTGLFINTTNMNTTQLITLSGIVAEHAVRVFVKKLGDGISISIMGIEYAALVKKVAR